MRKIVSGVSSASDMFPGLVLVTTLAGVMRGAGTSIIRPLVTTLCSPPIGQVSTNEITYPSTTTKMCWIAALSWVGVINLPGVLANVTFCVLMYNSLVLAFLLYRLEALLKISGKMSEVRQYFNSDSNSNETELCDNNVKQTEDNDDMFEQKKDK